ncbi:MAG: ATP-binding protein [Phycisphaeraceae bacterium]
MASGVRISLANKCQLLFGAAVVLILTAALVVVWQRMQTLVEQLPRQRAQDLAAMWQAGELAAAAGDAATMGAGLAPGRELAMVLVEPAAFASLAEADAFFERALDRFTDRPEERGWFAAAEDASGGRYYRYAYAVRESPSPGPSLEGKGAEAAASAELAGLLLIDLRSPQAATQQMVNRIYIVAAGTFAGLLALGVFWFITTRLILSPVRLLRDVAAKVSDGDIDIRSDINTGDEFQELSERFNTMLANLKEKQDQLRSINKSLDLKLGELAQSNVALYEANKIKGEFLANVSHELRTPLNSMIGFAEVLAETLPRDGEAVNEKRRRYVDNIISSSRRLLELITDLLDLAKIEAGRIDINVAPVSIADTVEGLVNLIRPQASQRKVALDTRIEPNLSVVRTDAGKLQQIVFNFLSNAVKFTPAGGTVTVTATQIPPARAGEQSRMRISVRDSGPGIALADQERIFDKFTQLDPSTTREHGGTGLGLTISRELAEMLQGRIDLDSDTGRGATFSITIPVLLEKRSVPLMPEVRG